MKPNVVWVTLESVRGDHTSVHGYGRDTTPELQRIAGELDGAAFPNCFAQSMWTPASSASILTGTHLFTHNVGYDGKAQEPLPSSLTTLPELLSNLGYHTACLSPNAYLSDATGLDRGFEQFRWISLPRLHRNRETIGPLLRYLLRLRTYGPGLTRDGGKHNKTYAMYQLLKKWLRSFAGDREPYFLYVHVPNPHLPYAPPRRWRDRFTNDIEMTTEAALDLSLSTYRPRERMVRAIASGCEFTAAEWAGIEAMYDAEIAYADEFVGRLFDHVRASSLRDTIFVVTGDHGDLFGERALLGHNLVLDDGLTHVPLVTHGLADVTDATEGIVQHIDVTRTLADSLDCPHEQFQGRDLRETTPTYSISQRGIPHFDEYLEQNPEFDTSRFHETPVTALRTAEYKYLQSEHDDELYQLPNEEDPVSDTDADVRERLGERLDAFLDGIGESGTRGDDDAAFTDEMEQQLEDLGYL